VTFNELREAYYAQAKGLVEGGADLFVGGNQSGHPEYQSGILAIRRLSREIGSEVPFIISVTIEPRDDVAGRR